MAAAVRAALARWWQMYVDYAVAPADAQLIVTLGRQAA
jgi:hypothetical protein